MLDTVRWHDAFQRLLPEPRAVASAHGPHIATDVLDRTGRAIVGHGDDEVGRAVAVHVVQVRRYDVRKLELVKHCTQFHWLAERLGPDNPAITTADHGQTNLRDEAAAWPCTMPEDSMRTDNFRRSVAIEVGTERFQINDGHGERRLLAKRRAHRPVRRIPNAAAGRSRDGHKRERLRLHAKGNTPLGCDEQVGHSVTVQITVRQRRCGDDGFFGDPLVTPLDCRLRQNLPVTAGDDPQTRLGLAGDFHRVGQAVAIVVLGRTHVAQPPPGFGRGTGQNLQLHSFPRVARGEEVRQTVAVEVGQPRRVDGIEPVRLDAARG